MRLPSALAPLRHRLFRMLWGANIIVSLGVWMQSTSAGWMMTSLSPNALMVSLVQAATIVPVFLFALPAGAIADIVDRRTYILATQIWMLGAAVVLTLMTLGHLTDAWSLLALTFAIGLGAAMNNPAWGSVMAEAVPRSDLVQAIALNGVGFNIARAVGPALAGFLLLAGGPGLTFGLNAVSYLVVIAVLLMWHRRHRVPVLPREHFLGVMKTGMRFVRHTPSMQAAMLRAAAFFLPGAAPWAMLPLVVREQLGLGAGVYGILLGLMGIGGVTAGLLLPQIRTRFKRGNIVFVATLLSCTGMFILGISRHWLPAAVGMLLFGLGWVSTSSITQGAAQMASPGWVRARALSIYQLSFNFALATGTFFWGWLGTQVGLTMALVIAALAGAVLAVAARGLDIDTAETRFGESASQAVPDVETISPALAPVLEHTRGRVLESQHYRIAPESKDAFLSAMAEVRDARGRGGAVLWHLGEDISAPEHWVELWWVENWTDHLREAGRLSDLDRAALAYAMSFHIEGQPLPTRRFLSITPHRVHGSDRRH
jgi:MFS family permease